MFNFIKLSIAVLVAVSIGKSAYAQVEFQTTKDMSKKNVSAAGFLDYDPFGKKYKEGDETFYDNIVKDFVIEATDGYNFNISDRLDYDYEDVVNYVRRGRIDLLYGMYGQTEMYEGIDIVYPSIISNPVTIVMLPARIGEVKSIKDLEKLKGGVNKNEVFSDFVRDEIKKLNVKSAKTSNELFEMLFTGKIDYIITGYYYGIAEASKLGLRNKVSFSKQSIWNMPLFIGISKSAPHRDILMFLLEKASESPNATQKMRQRVIDAISKIERKNIGAVPPAYSAEKE